jgi:hypothetical protein
MSPNTQTQTSDEATVAPIYLLTVGKMSQPQLNDAPFIILIVMHGNRRLYPVDIRQTANVED